MIKYNRGGSEMTTIEPQSPMAVANYVIEHARKHNQFITNLHLQKILYFLQAATLVKFESPIIKGDFSKWNYGPVLREVYSAYKDYGSSPIDDFAPNIDIDNGEWTINEPQKIDTSILEDKTIKSFIDNTVSKLLDMNAWKLVDLTHEQDLWKNEETEIVLHSANDYSNSEIKQYFEENPEYQIWN